MSMPGGGISTAISSGSAFGGSGGGGGKGGPGPGEVHSILNIMATGLSKVGKSETQIFSGDLLGGSGAGGTGLGNTNIFSKLFDSVAVGADAKLAFAAWADAKPSGSEEGSSGSNNSGGGGSNHAFPTSMGAANGAMSAGMQYLGAMNPGANVSPTATPSVGAGRSSSMGM